MGSFIRAFERMGPVKLSEDLRENSLISFSHLSSQKPLLQIGDGSGGGGGGREVSGSVTLSGTSDAILPTLSENLKVDWGISTLPDCRPPRERILQ